MLRQTDAWCHGAAMLDKRLCAASITATSTWNHKSVLRPILRDGHFVASSGWGL